MGLNVISWIKGDLCLYLNPLLCSLDGLNGLNAVDGHVNIGYEDYYGQNGNPSLVNLSGLNNLSIIGSSLIIIDNSSLTSIEELVNLTSVGSISIKSNISLISLTGLENLTSIGGYIWIGNNYSLASLTGLENIDASSISYLNIYANDALSNCAVQSICDFLAIPNSYSQFYANATGCNSTAEVDSSCVYLSDGQTKMESEFSIYPNPSINTLIIEISPITTLNMTTLAIFNINGQQITQQEIREPQTEVDITSLNAGIYFMKIICQDKVLVKKIVKN